MYKRLRRTTSFKVYLKIISILNTLMERLNVYLKQFALRNIFMKRVQQNIFIKKSLVVRKNFNKRNKEIIFSFRLSGVGTFSIRFGNLSALMLILFKNKSSLHISFFVCRNSWHKNTINKSLENFGENFSFFLQKVHRTTLNCHAICPCVFRKAMSLCFPESKNKNNILV